MSDGKQAETRDVGFFLINLFLVALGLRCSAQSFSSWGERGATLHCSTRASHCSGFSSCGAQAVGSRTQLWWRMGLAAPPHVESSQTRDQTRIPCIGRWILIHCTAGEVQRCVFKGQLLGTVGGDGFGLRDPSPYALGLPAGPEEGEGW